uniref:Uncharacterized protein n=1 Tax=Anguilla anguilla TaxID=7936 RepID=A0A0E9QTL8_ANGAN
MRYPKYCGLIKANFSVYSAFL